jgi:hypothetical protein
VSASPARRGLDRLLAAFPDRDLERVDAQLPHPIEVYDVVGWACEECDFRTEDEAAALAHSDERKHSLARERAARPYRQWDLPAGPWLLVKFADTGAEYAIWKPTGAIYEVDPGGAVGEDPVAL